MWFKLLTVAVLSVAVSGCWNGENVHVSLGDVSVGQQLLDLKEAYDGEALTLEEYEATKQTLLALNNVCQNTNSDDDSNEEGAGEKGDGWDWF